MKYAVENVQFKLSSLSLSVAAVTAAFAMSPGIALAQEVQDDELLEEIQVTGTRIRTTSGFTTPVPVTSLTTTELDDLEPGNTIAEQLDALPQFFNNQTSQRGGGTLFSTAGASGLNIRDLASNRTLVLLDGSRVVPTDKRGTVNVDLFPTALVRSVDVVTGGASAAYGADAVGGTVNFVLDREFEGLKVKVGTGMHETGEGKQWEFEIAGGRQFGDRLNAIGSLQAREIDEVKPDWTRLENYKFWGHITNPAWSPGASPGVPQRLTRPWVTSATSSPTGLIRGTGTILDNYKFTTDGEDIVPFAFGEGACQGGRGCQRNMAGGPEAEIRKRAFNFSAGPSGNEAVSRSAFLGLQYEFNERLSGYLEAMAGRTESNSRGSRSYEAQDLWTGSVAVDNAFLPENVRQIMIDNGLEEFELSKLGSFDAPNDIGGTQEEVNVFTQWQWGVGVDYLIPGVEWDLSLSWQRGESKRNSQGIERIRFDRMFLGMDAVREPETGAIVCRVQLFDPTPEELAASVAGLKSSRPLNPFLDPSASSVQAGALAENDDFNSQPLTSPVGLDQTIENCVPYNIMGSGNVSPEAIDYIGTPKLGRGFVDQDFAEALITGDLYEGWGYGPLSFAAGLTWRDQQFIDGAFPISVDYLGPPTNVPELGIRGFPPGVAGGSPNLHAFSTVPNVAGQTDVWEWFAELNIPVWEASLLDQAQRLTLNGGFRRSNYDRSGAVDSWKLGVDLQVLDDVRLRWTRSQDVREPTFAELFDAQGGGGNVNDPRFNNTSFSLTTTTGGNPDLSPEQAETVTFGVVWQPTFAPWAEGLQLSLDWYDVKIHGAVDTLGIQRIVDECELNGVQELCAQILRNPQTGEIGRILDTFLNVAQARVEGVDTEIVYRMEPDFFDSELESFSLRALAGYIMERSDTPFGGQPFDVAGSRGTPELTGVVTGTYGLGPYTLQLSAQHIDSVKYSARWVEGVDVDDNTIPSSTWVNARIGYSGEMDNGASWDVNLSIQNLFDREPPVIPGFGSRGGGQSIDESYDIFGRRYNMSLNYSF